jgi:hypothetical protein
MDMPNIIQASGYSSIPQPSLNKLRVYGGGPRFIKIGARVVYDRAGLDVRVVGKTLGNTSQTAIHSYRAA